MDVHCYLQIYLYHLDALNMHQSQPHLGFQHLVHRMDFVFDILVTATESKKKTKK